MPRMKLAALAAASMLTIALAVPAAAGSGGACPKGVAWDTYELLARDDELIADLKTEYPSVKRALEADPQFYTDQEAVDGFRGTDRNDNDVICIKDVFKHSNASDSSQGFYYYVSTIDDNVRS